MAELYKKTEYITVKRKERECGTLRLSSPNIEIVEKLTKDHLYWLPIERTAFSKGYSHIVREYNNKINSAVEGVISRNLEKAQTFRELYKKDEKTTYEKGGLLGYPKCCINFFSSISYEYFDPLFQIAQNTINNYESKELNINLNPFTNIFLRYFGPRIIPHFPCEFNCQKSISLGKKWYNIMKEIDCELANQTKKILEQPFTWECYKGLVIFENEFFIGITNSMPTKDRLIIHGDPS